MKVSKRVLRVVFLLLLLGYSTAFLIPTIHRGAVSHTLAAAGDPAAPAIIRHLTTPESSPLSRVVVLFGDLPLGQYRDTISGRGARLTVGERAQLRAYKKRLQSAHTQFLGVAQAAGIPLAVHHEFTGLLNGLALSAPTADLPQLASLPGVIGLVPDSEVTLPPETAVSGGAAQTGALSGLDALSATGAGVRVAIIDSGIDYTHPDLGGCFGRGCRVVDGYDFVNKDPDPRDDNGHGTHCAGIVGANGVMKGVAPGVTFYAYKVVSAGGLGYASTLVAGIERAADPDQDPGTADAVDIISISLGGGDHPDDLLSRAADAAVSGGVIVVASAGNEGPEYGRLNSPGVARQAISVGAIDNAGHVASFSSRGPVPGFDRLMKPQILAPGVAVNSTWLDGAYLAKSGTSMAAPHVAGAAALLKQKNPDWTPLMVETALLNKALGLANDIYTQGAGQLNLSGLTDIPLLAGPAIINLGTAVLDEPLWTATQLIQVRNMTAETRSVTLTAAGVSPGMTATLQPAALTLGPQQIGSSVLAVTVNNAAARPDLGSNQGRVLIQSGSYQGQLPFAYRLPDLFQESATLPYAIQSSFGLALGDLDGDGDSDLFVANANYYGRPGNTVWFNNGEGLFVDSGQQLGDSFSWAVALGDLDADGDLDAFVANSGEEDPLPDAVWFNSGDGTFSRSAQSLGNSHSRDVKLGDLDGDGDLDAFVANSYFSRGQGEASLVWLNNGQGAFADSGQRLGAALSQAVDLGDLDGDGDLDAFLANGVSAREYGRANTVWFNNGAGRFSDSGQLLGGAYSQDVALGDLDGDGDLDAFLANGGAEAGDLLPDEVWVNDGAARFSDSGQRLGLSASFGAVLADLHGDGHLDAFVAAHYGGSKVWLNNGRGQMNLQAPASLFERAMDVAAADLDGDGDMDALAANGLGAHNRLWLNRGSGEAAGGELRVLTSRADATWRVAGPTGLTGRGSRTIAGVPAGTYRIQWGSAPGCASPAAQSRTLPGGGSTTFDGVYGGCPPSPPVLLFPPDGGAADATPSLGWLAVAGAGSYRLQLDDNANFGSPVVDKTIADTAYTLPGVLTAGRYHWRVLAAGASGSSGWSPARALDVAQVAALPFADDFESGKLRPEWRPFATQDGRVRVAELPDAGGSQAVLLDDAQADDDFSQAAADLLIDLQTPSSVVLSFTWRSWREAAPHRQSGVYLSADYGRSWHKILTFSGVTPVPRAETVALETVAAAHSLTLNDHMLLRFLALDDRPLDSLGGLAIDDVRLAAGPRAPSALTVAAAAQDSARLIWVDNATDESTYHIERRTGDTAPFVPLATVPANTTRYDDPDLGCGGSYSYRVRAYRAADGAYSAYSNTAVFAAGPCNYPYRQFLPAIFSRSGTR